MGFKSTKLCFRIHYLKTLKLETHISKYSLWKLLGRARSRSSVGVKEHPFSLNFCGILPKKVW